MRRWLDLLAVWYLGRRGYIVAATRGNEAPEIIVGPRYRPRLLWP